MNSDTVCKRLNRSEYVENVKERNVRVKRIFQLDGLDVLESSIFLAVVTCIVTSVENLVVNILTRCMFERRHRHWKHARSDVSY